MKAKDRKARGKCRPAERIERSGDGEELGGEGAGLALSSRGAVGPAPGHQTLTVTHRQGHSTAIRTHSLEAVGQTGSDLGPKWAHNTEAAWREGL